MEVPESRTTRLMNSMQRLPWSKFLWRKVWSTRRPTPTWFAIQAKPLPRDAEV